MAKPSAVVVLLSVSAQWTSTDRDQLPGNDEVIVVTVDLEQPERCKEGHMSFPGQLPHLKCGFDLTSLVIHGGGVGISEQVVHSGTPSICVSSDALECARQHVRREKVNTLPGL